MVTTTTITITQKGKRHPSYTFSTNRRLNEEQVHDIVQKDGLIGLDPAKCNVNVFFNTTDHEDDLKRN